MMTATSVDIFWTPFSAGFECRTFVRDVLASYLGEPADIAQTSYGQPYCTNDPTLKFSVTHSGGLCLLALTRERPIGIDLECAKAEIDFASIARDYFTSRERAHFSTRDEAEKPSVFFRIWKQKEAISKALGLGLHLDFGSIGVEPDIAQECKWTEGLRPEFGLEWTLREISIIDGETAVVAVQGPTADIRVQKWSSL